MTTNLTNLTGAKGIYDLAIFVTSETNQLFFTMLLVVIFIVLVMRLLKHDALDAVWTASFVCFILAMILSYLKLCPATAIFIFFAIWLITGLWAYLSRGNT